MRIVLLNDGAHLRRAQKKYFLFLWISRSCGFAIHRGSNWGSLTPCSCGFAIHRGSNCGSITRADYKSAITDSGIANPRGQRGLHFSMTRHPFGVYTKKYFSFLGISCPYGFLVPVDLQSTGGITAGLWPARSLVHFSFAWLFISSLHEQRRNRTKEETRRLLAKKLKIKACFPKLAKRPRSARLNEARSLRKTSSIFYTLFC